MRTLFLFGLGLFISGSSFAATLCIDQATLKKDAAGAEALTVRSTEGISLKVELPRARCSCLHNHIVEAIEVAVKGVAYNRLNNQLMCLVDALVVDGTIVKAQGFYLTSKKQESGMQQTPVQIQN